MRIIYLALLSLLILSLDAHHLRATHAMGADITYECLSGNTYQVTLRFYRDCNGVLPLTQVILGVNSISCGQSQTMTANLQTGYPVEVSPLCPSQLSMSACNGGALPGVQEYLYKGTITLPSSCRDWTFSFSEGFRNNAITTIDKPGSTYLYVESLLNNVDAPCNNSPTFTSIPTPYVCVNQPYLYNHGATDPEGDSLVYRLANALNASGTSVTYLTGYSGGSPLSSSPAVAINSTNGSLSFTPQALEITVMAVVVDEYRNGIKIGSVTRDMQVTVLSCSNNNPNIGAISSLTGGLATSSYSIDVCPGVPLSFTLSGIDTDLTDSLSMSWNAGISGASFTANPGTSPVSATFNWTPTLSDLGQNSFVVNLKDNACPIIGQQAISIEIVVRERTTAGPDQAICGGTGNVQLSALGGTSFTWRTLSGPNHSLSCTSCPNPVASPTSTTTYEVLSNFPCVPRDTITVHVIPGFSLNLSADTTICDGSDVGLLASPSVAGTYTYAWSPSPSLSGATTANPLASPTSTQTYTVKVKSVGGCEVTDSVKVTLAANNLSASPTSSASQYCAGQPISLFANVAAASCDIYTVQNIPFSPVTGSGTSVSLNDDQVSSAIPIGFSFNFYCNDYTNLYLSSNGWLSFNPQSDAYYATDPIPSTGQANNVIAFAWDDLDPSSGGLIEYFTTGTAPNRQCIINYINVPHYSCASCLIHTQIILNEGSNAVEIHNTRIDNHGSGGTMSQGIENVLGTSGVAVGGRNASTWTASNDAVRFSRSALPGTYNVNWQSPLGVSVGTGENIIHSPGSPTTYYAITSDPTGTCHDTSSLFVDVAYIDAGPDQTIFVGDTAQINATYSGPPPVVDCNAYSVSSIPFGWVNGGTSLTIPTNGLSVSLPIGFSFDYYCNTYTSLRVAEDGFISFTATTGNNSNTNLPTLAAPNAMLAAVWDNLKQRNFSEIRYLRLGSAPNRRFIVTYDEVVHYTLAGGGNRIYVQIVLYEGSNLIEIHSQRVDSDGGQSTQGIESPNGLNAMAVPGRNNTSWSVPSSSPEARRFTPPSQTLQYAWSPAPTLHNSSAEDPKAGPIVDTQYFLTVDNGECILTDSMWVFIRPLSVSLMDFWGEMKSEQALLSWETAEEYQSSHFVIERSGDGIIFEELSQVAAAGTSQEFHAYEYLDTNPYHGINYYRLKMVDLDGKVEQSDIIELVKKSDLEPQLLMVYPNPSQSVFNFDIMVPQMNSASLYIIAMDGRVVKRLEQVFPVAGRYQWPVELAELSSGMYLYRIAIGEKQFDGKISLIK